MVRREKGGKSTEGKDGKIGREREREMRRRNGVIDRSEGEEKGREMSA